MRTNRWMMIALALSAGVMACAAPVGDSGGGERGAGAAGKADHNAGWNPPPISERGPRGPHRWPRERLYPGWKWSDEGISDEAWNNYVEFNENHALFHYWDWRERPDLPPLERQQDFLEALERALGTEVEVDVGYESEEACPLDGTEYCDGYLTLRLNPTVAHEDWPLLGENGNAGHFCSPFLRGMMMGLWQGDLSYHSQAWNVTDSLPELPRLAYDYDDPYMEDQQWIRVNVFSYFLLEGERPDARGDRPMSWYSEERGYTCNYTTGWNELSNRVWHDFDQFVEEWRRQTNGDGPSGALPAKEDWPPLLRERVREAVEDEESARMTSAE
jgi:hypothetical protein